MPLSEGYRVRPAVLADLQPLQEVERASSRLFIAYGLEESFWGLVTPVDALERACQQGMLWVAVDAGDQPVGFALVKRKDGAAHLDELAVHPVHGRRGLGTALVEAVCGWAREQGLPSVTLSTLRDVPFNAPFYTRLGFVEMPETEAGPELRGVRRREQEAGFPMQRRLLMRRTL
jgi:GNAT superfamily N-acetyltransferase